MRLREYLPKIQPAVEKVLSDLYTEHDYADQLRQEVGRLTAATIDGYNRAEQIANSSDMFDDDPLLATAVYWDTYFGADKDRYYKDQELEDVKRNLVEKEISVGALAGSVLQFAKQGIALQYGPKKEGCPSGRMIGSQALSDVIWLARNQAIHWEDRDFNKKTEECFQKLATEAGAHFSNYKVRNMVFEVVSHLGWRNFDDFTNDLLLLDP